MRLIDADAVKLPKGYFENVTTVPRFYEWLDTLPTIDAVPVKHRKWLKGQFVEGVLKCPFCGFVPYDPGGCDTFNYCSNCGAKMEVEDDECE